MFLWHTLKPATLLAVLRSTRPGGRAAPSKGDAAAQPADAGPSRNQPPQQARPAPVSPRFGGSGTR